MLIFISLLFIGPLWLAFAFDPEFVYGTLLWVILLMEFGAFLISAAQHAWAICVGDTPLTRNSRYRMIVAVALAGLTGLCSLWA
jgi:hypothetical protein